MWQSEPKSFVQKEEDVYWIDNLSDEQKEKYKQFRTKLTEEKLLYPGQDSEITIKQFLQARQYNLDKATLMYKNYIDWYKQDNIENIVSEYDYPELPKVLRLYPQFYYKTDKFGRPVYIQILGQLDTTELLKATTLDRYIRYHVKTWEQLKKYILPVCTQKTGRPIFSCTTILDLKGLGMKNFTSTARTFLARTSKIDSDNYPEQLGQMFVINAPSIFTFIWSFMKPYLDVRTQSKIIVLGANYQDALFQVVPKDNLPDFIGGTNKYDLQNIKDVGDWDTTYTSKENKNSESKDQSKLKDQPQQESKQDTNVKHENNDKQKEEIKK